MPNWKVIATVLVGALVGFMLNPQSPAGAAVWGSLPEGGADPTGPQIGLLMAVALLEAVAFGVGLAFLAFGWPSVRRLLGEGLPSRLAWLAIAWGLVSWVPHSAMHQTNGADDFGRLIAIEYIFHVTLVLGAAALAWAMVRSRDAAARTHATANAHVE